MVPMTTITSQFETLLAANAAPSYLLDSEGLVVCRECAIDRMMATQGLVNVSTAAIVAADAKRCDLIAYEPKPGDDWCSLCDADIAWTQDEIKKFSV